MERMHTGGGDTLYCSHTNIQFLIFCVVHWVVDDIVTENVQ